MQLDLQPTPVISGVAQIALGLGPLHRSTDGTSRPIDGSSLGSSTPA
jgi:hypothetical protein